MKKFFKWVGIVLLSPILLFIILAALLYLPPVQNWVAQKVATYASEKTGMEITVEHVDLDFPLDLGIDGMRVIKPAPEGEGNLSPDTIADIRRVVADVQFWPLLKGMIVLDALQLHDAKLNTLDFIDDMRLQGTIGNLSFSSPGIDPSKMEMELRSPKLTDADLHIFMSDTAAIDTSTTGWRIRFERFDFERTHLGIVLDSAALFADSATRIKMYMEQALIADGDIDLGLSRYSFGKIDWQDGAVNYNNDLSISQLSLGLDSLYSYGDELRLGIGHGSMHISSPFRGSQREPSELELTTLQGQIAMNGDAISIKDFKAQTPYSSLNADTSFDPTGISDIDVNASIGKEDLQLIGVKGERLGIRGRMSGTMEQMDVRQLSITMPSVGHIETSGQIGNLNDIDHLLAQLDLKANIYDPSALQSLVSLPAGYRIPRGLGMQGSIGVNGQRYTADLTARDAGGTARLKGTYTPVTDSYTADIAVRNLDLHRFMPQEDLGLISADVRLNGKGMDPLAPSSQMDADIRLHHLDYGQMSLDSLTATATLREGRLKAQADANLADLDMLALGIGNEGSLLGMTGSIELESDLKNTHKVSALLSNISIRDSVKAHHPENVGILLKAGSDTTVVRMQSGDFIVKLDSRGDYQQLLSKMGALADTIGSQLKNRTIDQPLLKSMLPTAKLYITSQRNNPVADILRAASGIDFKDLNIDLTMSPSTGLNGVARIDRLTSGDMQLDTLRLTLVEKERGLTFNGQVTNNRKNPMAVFNVLFDGFLQEHGASFGIRYFDEQGLRNIRIGAKAEMADNGINFQLIPQRPTLGYKEFALNDDNFLLLHDDLKMEANIDLKADDGTHIKIYTADQDSTMLQDITISANRLDLGELTSGVAFLPKITGMMEGDYHLLMDADHNISVASDMHINQMSYEGSPIGNLGAEFVYLLREDGTHVVDATLNLEDEPIGTLQGSYLSGKRLDATLELTHMPLSIANGFMPDQLFGFEGFADGTLSIKGELSKLMANGEVKFSDGYFVSDPYGVRMRFGDTPLRIENSRLLFDDFALYANTTENKSQLGRTILGATPLLGRVLLGSNTTQESTPLNISGNVDLLDSDGDKETIDLRLTARNFQLVNARQKKESVAYGRMFVNFFARLNGNLEQLKMRGRLDVLGTTDLNYILLDSPLSTDNQMDELVRFTDFSDTTQVAVVQRPESDALNIDMQISIDQGAHARCALNADQTNYVDLQGGGDLRLQMDGNGMNLRGRYTVESGTMKYSLPVIPLKTFTIKEGSYVEFTGQADNPTLNLTATERKRAAVGTDDGQSRNVAFDCGVVITQTLENMGLQFTIDAPEDMQVQNELNSMSTEQRGKLAVTMLTTGMYLADGNTSAFSMNSALSSFLQSEINNITAGALKTVDLQVGLDNTTDAAGQTHTDYSFRFAKRFWNNRLNVQIGGRVSTGAEMQGQNQSFFDNVTMEYRLSPTSNQYLKLFYNQNVYDWLEGYTGEYGGGYIWKKKLDKLTDLFKKPTPTPSLREGRPNRPATLVSPRGSISINNDSIE